MDEQPYCPPKQTLNRAQADSFPSPPDPCLLPNRSHSDSRPEAMLQESIAARKVQKADREKLRRDRLNEQFAELGSTLDPDRPKNDKASILADTIQMLNDLTAQVTKLKSEYAALTEESRELTQEKNDLREEKASLKADIENLNLQYQQRLRAMYPWGSIDPSVIMHPPSYPFPLPMPIPPGPIPMHPTIQPYPFFANQNPTVVSNPCSTFIPYLNSSTPIEQQSVQHISPHAQPSSRPHLSSKQGSRSKLSDHGESEVGKEEDSNDVATDLELKTPGSTGDRIKSKKSQRKDNSVSDGSYSSKCSSSRTVQASSSNSIVGDAKADD